MALSEADFNFALRNLDALEPGDKQHILTLLQEREHAAKVEEARKRFLPFVKLMWPSFIAGAHHTIMAEAFEKLVEGYIKRLIINMPPRFTKSELSSWLLPAWTIGRDPESKLIQSSNTEGLASGFGRRVRNLISGEGGDTDQTGHPFAEVFPDVWLAKDSQAAAGWHTNRGGEYFAIGVNGKVTGKGANLAVIDDAHSEQEAKQAETNPEVFDTVWNWYSSGIRQRLQPGGKIVIPMTRWSKRDLTGRLIKQMQDATGAHDKWEVISFPAILDEGTPTERSMWPGYWPLEELQRTRAALPVAKWQAQYMQEPTSETAAILKREYWRRWGSDTEKCPGPMHQQAWYNIGDDGLPEPAPPACDYVLQSWDCAATKNDRSNYNACTTWGVFKAEDKVSGKTINNIILLEAWKARMEFPELKKRAKEFYDKYQPDTLLIENKSAGMQLIQEFRSMGIAVENFSGSSRGSRLLSNDKIARTNMVADVFASGYVWIPDGIRSAEMLVEECADFPNGEFDDQVDSTVQALIRFRTGGFIRTANDEEEDDTVRRFRRKRYY